jgi:hypothetical protein
MHLNIIPVMYSKCGHSINVPSPGIHDPEGKLLDEFEATHKPVVVEWDEGKCLKCTPVTPVGKETIAELAKVKYGEHYVGGD